MGSYKNVGNVLPFLSEDDWRTEIRGAERLFQALKGRGSNPNLLGVPLYIAYIHTGKDVKILEINSRPGDPEIINILPVIEEDLVEICYKILDGDLRSISLKRDATVVIYKVPPTYGDYLNTYPKKVDRNQLSLPVDLSKAQEISQRTPDKLRVYPASMELRDNQIYPLKSRAVCTVGIGDSISHAVEISLDALEKIQGGALWYRSDIASYSHRETSIKQMRRLRSL